MAHLRCALLLLLLLATSALVVPAPVVTTALGAVAGAAGAFAVYPIDYVKTQLQCEDGCRYEDGLDAAATIFEEGGLTALYRGLPTQLLGVAPEKAIKLSVNEAARAAITAACGGLPLAGEVFAGACAGTSQVVVTNPLEVIKVGLQTDSSAGALELIREVGPAGLYKGAVACVVRDATFSAILFPTYAHAKLLLAAAGAGGPLALGVAGTLAAAPAAFFTTPADCIKTRMQERREADGEQPPPLRDVLDADAADADAPAGAGRARAEERGVLAIGASIVADEGGAALFSGALERVLRSAPQFGVTLALFDVLKSAAVEYGLL